MNATAALKMYHLSTYLLSIQGWEIEIGLPTVSRTTSKEQFLEQFQNKER